MRHDIGRSGQEICSCLFADSSGKRHTGLFFPIILYHRPRALIKNKLSTSLMSHSHLTAASIQLVINNALKSYENCTKIDLLAHPLVFELQACNSPAAILTVLHQQVRGLDQSRSSDPSRQIMWLDQTVKVLYTSSATLEEYAGLVSLWKRVSLRWQTSYIAAILTREGDNCWSWCSSLGAHPSSCLPAINITPASISHRKLRILDARIHSSGSSSASKASFNASRFTQKCPRNCRRPWKRSTRSSKLSSRFSRFLGLPQRR